MTGRNGRDFNHFNQASTSVRQFPGVNGQFNSNSDFSSLSGLNANELIMGMNKDFAIEGKVNAWQSALYGKWRDDHLRISKLECLDCVFELCMYIFNRC